MRARETNHKTWRSGSRRWFPHVRAHLALLCVVLLTLFGAQPIHRVEAAGTDVVVTGVVQDNSGQPLEGVSVNITSDATITPLSVSTNKGGAYRLVVPVSSALTVRAAFPSYVSKEQSQSFSGAPPAALTVDFTGANALVALPALIVSAPVNGLAQGDTLVVTSRAYAPGTNVTVSLANTGLSQTGAADSSGAIHVSIILPYSLVPGIYDITANPPSNTSPVLIVRAAAVTPTSVPQSTATPAPSATATSLPVATPSSTSSPTPSSTATAPPTATSTPMAVLAPHPARRAHFAAYGRRWSVARLARLVRDYPRLHSCPKSSKRRLCHHGR